MASITHDKATGRRTIQVVCRDGKRRPIRLGKVPAKVAEAAKGHVEKLAAFLWTREAVPAETAEWVAGLPGLIRQRIEAAGLIGPDMAREKAGIPTLGEWLGTYLTGRLDVKAGTATFFGHTKRNLLEFLGEDTPLDEITPGDADEFRIHLTVKEDLADSTVRRRCRMAKQFFRAAVKKRLIAENPFADIKASDRPNDKRFYFVKPEQAQAILAACPDVEWRLIFALCRFGGLRCPSEVLRLTWADIDWSAGRFTVHASKTEHHADGGVRVVPIFPELAPHLQAAFDAAEPGQEYVVTRCRAASVNLRTQLSRIIKRAGMVPWGKLFQNLRSTRETELAETFPIHTVCAWIGNSPRVADRHYLQVTEEHFARAVQKAVQNPVQYPAQQPATYPATTRDDSRDTKGAQQEDPTIPDACEVSQKIENESGELQTVGASGGMGPEGFEPSTKGL